MWMVLGGGSKNRHIAPEDWTGFDAPFLVDLKEDPGETRSVAAEHPERARAMHAAWKRWDASNQEPRWGKNWGRTPRVRHARVSVLDKEIRMQCTGNDPQILFSNIPPATGPLTLELKLKSSSKGAGMVFWNSAAKPEFSAESSVTFSPNHDGQQWHEYTVVWPAVTPAITHLRLDPGNAPGLVRIARIVLKDASGKVVKSWIE